MTAAFKFSERSKRNLDVHPDLKAVAIRALKISEIDFIIVDGGRTLAEQRNYVRTGKSKTMKSRHLNGFAFDFVAIDPKTGKVSWALPLMKKVADACKQAAKELKIPGGVEWGGDWKSFKDTPHIQLSARYYK
jgi:peptidoglycan L-alanyl-D-glutamate endopeptidase CwlK